MKKFTIQIIAAGLFLAICNGLNAQTTESNTQLTLKQLTPVRMMKNEFFREVQEAEKRGATVEELNALLGRARAKKGMFEGDMEQGEIGGDRAVHDTIPSLHLPNTRPTCACAPSPHTRSYPSSALHIAPSTREQ